MMTKMSFVVFLILAFFAPCFALGAGSAPLKLVQTISLPDVRGGFDHLAADVAGHRLFIAAEGQHAVEVIDLRTGNRLREVPGFKRPHAIVYLPRMHELFVTDGGAGVCDVLDSTNYRLLKTIKLQIDADSSNYDPRTQRLFVVSGGSDAHQSYSFVSIIDTRDRKNLKDIKIPCDHVEALRVDESGRRIFVNLTGDNQVGVINLGRDELTTKWDLPGGGSNVPMDIDRADHRLFVVTRRPAKLFVLDTENGKMIAALDCSGGADDLVYDRNHRMILVSCGEGFINVYHQTNPNQYTLAAKIASAPRARTSLWVPSLHRYYVAVPAGGREPARILVYLGP